MITTRNCYWYVYTYIEIDLIVECLGADISPCLTEGRLVSETYLKLTIYTIQGLKSQGYSQAAIALRLEVLLTGSSLFLFVVAFLCPWYFVYACTSFQYPLKLMQQESLGQIFHTTNFGRTRIIARTNTINK